MPILSPFLVFFSSFQNHHNLVTDNQLINLADNNKKSSWCKEKKNYTQKSSRRQLIKSPWSRTRHGYKKERQKHSKDLEGEFFYYLLTQQRATTTEVVNNRAMFYERETFDIFFDILIELKSFLLEKVTKIAFSFLLWAWMVLRKIYTHFLYGLVTSFDFLTCRILLFRGNLKVDVKAMQL